MPSPVRGREENGQAGCKRCPGKGTTSKEEKSEIRAWKSQCNREKSLRIGSLNIDRGYFSKENEIKAIIEEEKLDILFLQEINIKDFSDSSICFPGFNYYVNSGPVKRTCTLVRQGIFKGEEQLNPEEKSAQVWLAVEEKSGRKTVLGNIYREWRKEEGAVVDNICLKLSKYANGRVLLAGDFNFDLSKEGCPGYGPRQLMERLLNCALEYGLERTSFGQTFMRCINGTFVKSELDWILANIPILRKTVKRSAISDHDLITWGIEADHSGKKSGEENLVTFRNLKKVNKLNFAHDFAAQPWENFPFLNADDMADSLNKFFLEALDNNAPLQTFKSKLSKQPRPSQRLRKLRRKRDNARSKGNKSKLRDLRKECQELSKLESCHDFKMKIENKNTREVWDVINGYLGKNKADKIKIISGNETLSDSDAASAFNSYFIEKIERLKQNLHERNEDTFKGAKNIARKNKVEENSLSFQDTLVTCGQITKILKSLKPSTCPDIYGIPPKALQICPEILAGPLSLVIQAALREGKFPRAWKIARVIPVHKRDSKTSVVNYRPISILPSFSKVLETVIKNQLNAHLEKNKILPNSQFGFRGGLSTHDAIYAAEHDWRKWKEAKKPCGALLFDLSAAFDTMDPDILLEKLRIYGSDNNFLSIISSFLSDRSQQVQIASAISDPISLTTGSPQGSILSPLLFLTLVSDIEEWLTKVKILSYADDTTLYACGETTHEVRNILEEGAIELLSFFGSMRLVANPSKTKFIMFNRNPEDPISVGEANIDESNEVCLLGILFNKSLSWNTQVSSLQTSLRQKIGVLRRLSHVLPKEITTSLVQPVFTSALLYSLPVIFAQNFEEGPTVQKIQTLHRHAMKAALGMSPISHPPNIFLWEATKQESLSDMAKYLLSNHACRSLLDHQSHPLTRERIIHHQRKRVTRQNERVFPPQAVNSVISSMVEFWGCH